ncbi:MAG: protein kinase [Pirellulaceae bacterium]
MTSPQNGLNDEDAFNRLGQESKLRVNQVCDQLEAAWQSSRTPMLAELVRLADSIPQVDRRIAIQELILVDSAHRKQSKLACTVSAYLELFPEVDVDWLTRQIAGDTDAIENEMARDDETKISIPQSLGDYEITGRLGAGGMGQVFCATHRIMKRAVAIKILHGQFVSDPNSRSRFEREVQAISRLSHPNIVTAYDAREYQDGLYLVTELVEGEDLSRLVKRKGPLRPREAVHFAWQAAKGLNYAHRQGIIHRDIKPGNLLLEKKKTIKVLDLGLARLLDNDSTAQDDGPSITRSGSLLGTATYMAPEQARSPLAADARSDIYSLGCTLFFLLTGAPPFRGESTIDTIMAHVEQPIPELPDEVKGKPLSSELKSIVRQMMAKSPDDRPDSMEKLIPLLESLIRQDSTAVSDTTPTVVIKRPAVEGRGAVRPANSILDAVRNGKPWMLAIVAVSIVAILAGTIAWNMWSARQFGPDNSGPRIGPSTLPVDGLDFDGRTAYIEFPGFKREIEGDFTIEVAAIPRPQTHPANLVSWAGPQLAALFINSDGRWGIAFFDGRESHLALSVGKAYYGEMQIVTARWSGHKFRMWVNGEAVDLEAENYELHPTQDALYVGGAPDDFLPPEQGVRYFDGTIACVRIANGSLASVTPSSDLAAMRSAKPANILQLDLLENSGLRVQDRSSYRRIGHILNARWVNR